MDYEQNFDHRCWYEEVCQVCRKEPECRSSCIRYSEMTHLVQKSGLPKSRWIPPVLTADEDYDAFLELANIKTDIRNKVQEGTNLYITSEYTGNGKTSWAIKLMLKYFDEVWAGNGFRTRAVFVHIPTLLLQLKNFDNPLSEEYKHDLMTVDLVVWDEIAYSGISNYDYTNLLMFLENRILIKKANIFTSNCNTKSKLDQIVGAKLASRIWETSTVIEFKGKDRR